jgi:hypothetical protein
MACGALDCRSAVIPFDAGQYQLLARLCTATKGGRKIVRALRQRGRKRKRKRKRKRSTPNR